MSATSFFQICDDPCDSSESSSGADGPPGPVGPAGPAGAAGPQGPPGADGADGAGAGGGGLVANSIAAARAFPSSLTNATLDINGDITGGDGVSHLHYTWDNLSVLANNNGSVLSSTDGGAGRWLQN